MRNSSLFLLTYLLVQPVILSGCTSRVVPLIPAIKKPIVIPVDNSHCPLININPTSKPSEVMKAYVASVYYYKYKYLEADKEIHAINMAVDNNVQKN